MGPLGTTYVSGILLGTRAFIAVLDPAGEIAWYEELDHTLTFGRCDRLVVNAQGQAYFSGELDEYMPGPWPAVFVAKARVGAGAPAMTVLANDADFTYPRGLAVDGDGNSYVVGLQETVAMYWEAFVAKLGPDLTPAWGPTQPFGFDTDATHVALDAHGDLYVAGTTGSYYDVVDASIAKLDASGNVRWPPKTFATEGSPYHWHSAEASAADLQGNVYVAGRTEAGVVVAKFDALGFLQ
jgi:hypothetical protein